MTELGLFELFVGLVSGVCIGAGAVMTWAQSRLEKASLSAFEADVLRKENERLWDEIEKALIPLPNPETIRATARAEFHAVTGEDLRREHEKTCPYDHESMTGSCCPCGYDRGEEMAEEAS